MAETENPETENPETENPETENPETTDNKLEANVQDLVYSEVMSRNFLLYSVSVLTDRALPDVRDGLLPVQRRIILAMHEANLHSKASYSKCAGIVGDTMKKYHPHGDSSIYGALVRMAQDFSLRVPLVDGHGAFGSLDGDPAAAMRYTEARLSELAEQLVNDLHPDLLPNDYGRNYDEKMIEPRVLPAAFPNLLINGAVGIAVGMTATLLPHNPGEILDLAIWRLVHPEAEAEQVIKRVSGPDFPTGALVVADQGLRDAYLTGQGKVTALAETHVEPMAGNREKIVITSIPWGVNKGKLLEKIAQQHSEGKFPEIVELNDFSRNDVRIEATLKWGANSRTVIQRLYKFTGLREVYGVAQNVLVKGQPKMLGMTGLLDEFLAFRRYVVIKRAEKRIREIERRLHQLDALLKALSAIDEVVALIKKAKDTETARNGLKKLLKVDDEQANWILEMQLRRLTQLDQYKLKEEVKTLRTELVHLQKFIKSPTMVTELISDELKDMKKRFASPRLTKLVDAAAVGSGGDGMTSFTVPAEDCLFLVSRDGYAANGQGTLRRGASMQLVGDDQMAIIAEARTDQEWLVFTNTGKGCRLRLADVPLENRKSKGIHLSKVIGVEQGEHIVAAHQIDKERENGTLLFVYTSGMIKRTAWSDFRSAHASGVVAAKPNPGDAVMSVLDCPEEADIVLVADNGKGIRFTAASVRPMGRASAGVRGMNLPSGAAIAGAMVIADPKTDQLLMVTATGFGKRIPAAEIPTQGRGGSGVAVMKVTPGSKYGQPTFIGRTTDKSDLWVEYGQGRLKHYPVNKLAKAGRAIVPKRFPAAEKAVGIFSIREEA